MALDLDLKILFLKLPSTTCEASSHDQINLAEFWLEFDQNFNTTTNINKWTLLINIFTTNIKLKAAVSCSPDAPRLPAMGVGLGLTGKLCCVWVGAGVVYRWVHGWFMVWCLGGWCGVNVVGVGQVHVYLPVNPNPTPVAGNQGASGLHDTAAWIWLNWEHFIDKSE